VSHRSRPGKVWCWPRELIDAGRIALILDGIDEVKQEPRALMVQALAQQATSLGRPSRANSAAIVPAGTGRPPVTLRRQRPSWLARPGSVSRPDRS
jgi:hypothetical protein